MKFIHQTKDLVNEFQKIYKTEEDKIRENKIFESIGADCLQITQQEYSNDKIKTIRKCLDFLMV